jgi:pentapeptide MXKDX repeat protein
MKGIIKGAVCAAIILTGGPAFAADPMSSDSTSHHKMMKDCMAKQKAQDSTMSKDDIKKACKAELSGANSMGGVSTPNQTTPTTKGSPAPSTGSATSPPPQ